MATAVGCAPAVHCLYVLSFLASPAAVHTAHSLYLRPSPLSQALEAMQQHGCKADALVYQSLIDLLWGTGVAWAQAQALTLYSCALRNWHFRFSVQMVGCAAGGYGVRLGGCIL